MQLETSIEERKEYLLRKVENRTLTESEALELIEILNKDAKIRELDERIRTLIILGIGAIAGYLLAKLLEEKPKQPHQRLLND